MGRRTCRIDPLYSWIYSFNCDLRLDLESIWIYLNTISLIPCSWKESFGIDCPSCGAQTSFSQLISGNFLNSFVLFPALFPLIIVFVLVILQIIRPKSNRPKWIVRFFAFSAVCMLVGWVLKF